MPIWGPSRLRHNAATLFRKTYGLEVAKALLGHRRVETSQIYAEVDRASAVRAMSEIG